MFEQFSDSVLEIQIVFNRDSAKYHENSTQWQELGKVA